MIRGGTDVVLAAFLGVKLVGGKSHLESRGSGYRFEIDVSQPAVTLSFTDLFLPSVGGQ